MQENRVIKAFEVVTGLEPSLCSALLQPSTIPLYEFVHSIPSCFSKCIITTVRLSGLSQRLGLHLTSLHPLQIGCSYHISVLHVNPLPNQAITLCVLQSIFSQLCKYYKHVLQCVGLGPRMPHYYLRFITLAQALRHPSLYTA